MFTPKLVVNYAWKWSHVQQASDYFSQQSFFRLVVLMTLFGWLWLGYTLQTNQLGPASGLGLMLFMMGADVLIYRLHQRHYLRAVSIFLAAQLLFITGVLWLTGHLEVGYVFIFVIFTAGALAGPISAFIVAGAAVIIELIRAGFAFAPADSSALLTGLIFLQILAAFMAGQASRGLYHALESAEASAIQASQSADEARLHRGQLQRTLKSLDLAHTQLQRANAEMFYAREIADRALRFKAEFAAKVSHELRTSLNLILGFSETMAFAQESYGVKLPAAYLRDVTEIYRHSRHLLALIDDILDLSKLEAGRMGLRREPVDLLAALRESVELVRPLIETKGLALRLDLPQTLPPLLLDRTRISQVLLNLLSNATRLTTAGQITVKAELLEGEIRVQVSDTGPGIPPADLPAVFEEFRQLEHSGGMSHTTGLGLTLSKQMVELQGGRMGVESVWGQGSDFFFAFPLKENHLPAPATRTPLPPYSPPQPALVALGQEESDEVKLLQRHLEGYTLVAASTWAEVRRLAMQMSARAVLVNGPVEAALAAESLPVPVVACPLPGPQQSLENLNVAGYLQKPITVETLHTALSQAAPTAQNLLIVDDNPSAVRLLERMALAGGHYRIFRAYSGQEALARIQAQAPDALLLDLVMADGDGYWLISALRGNPATASIPIIVVSGQAVEESYQGGPIGIVSEAGFTPTEALRYLQAILEVVPPTPVERHTNTPAWSAAHPA
ncbi:MAG: hybrid sensor histidine kinase/response regulator [Anaerolineae bacterium]